MLKKLTVSNLAVVERAEAEFAPGLNVVTGETGSGKSVFLGALELALGMRAEADVVREGAKEAEVEADFGSVVIRRTVTAQGRSRAWVNDESVSVAELRQLAEKLMDMHGPRANQALAEESFQREALDRFGGHAKALAEYGERWASWCAVRRQLEELRNAAGEEEIDFLRFQVNELESANLTEEDETVAERHAAAAHAEEIVESANVATEALGGERSVSTSLGTVRASLVQMARHLPSAEAWIATVDRLSVEADELSRTVADAARSLEEGLEDLSELDARLTLVNRLKRKYRVETVKDLVAALATRRAKLDLLENRSEALASLETKLSQAEAALRESGAKLTKLRKAAAKRLGEAVTRELRDLGFLRSGFAVEVSSSVMPESHGLDAILYRFAPNPGEPDRPLAAIASSGEIARVMLALKTVLASVGGQCRAEAKTLVFDEIDANVGGEAGRIVGEKLRGVAKGHQVIAITHLPQSAVYGERHLVVSKSVRNGRTRTEIRVAEGADRISEIARMLGGETLTSVARKHAAELLEIPR